MRILTSQNQLMSGLQIVQRAISTKNTLQFLSGIYLEAKDDVLRLRATDLEIAIECTIPVQVLEEGVALLPAKYFVEIVKRLPDLELTLEKERDSNIVTISYGSSQVQLNTYDPEEYPLLPEIEGQYEFEINCDLLINAVRQVIIAASNDTSRPIFTGVLMEVEKGQNVRLVSSDTHRLAYRLLKLNGPVRPDLNCSVIIPSRSLNELSRIFRPEDNTLEIKIAENQILFKAENVILISRLIEGQFPNYQQVIPQEYHTRIRIPTKAFNDSVERASLLSRDDLKTRSNVIKLKIQGNNLTITSNSAEIGNIHEELPIYMEGENMEIAFNGRYLTDVLRVIDQEEITLDLTGSLGPGIIRPVDSDNCLFLILPIRLS